MEETGDVSLGGDSEKTELLVRSARLARMRGELEGAEQALRETLAQDPASSEAAQLLGEVLLEKGDASSAKELLSDAIERHPGDAGLEEAYAKTVLALEEAEYRKAQVYTEALRRHAGARKSAALPVVASGLVYGLGQFLNDEPAKGALIAGVGYISLLLAFVLGGRGLVGSISSWIVGGNLAAATGKPSAALGPVSGFAVFLLVVSSLAWLVGIVDAAIVAKKQSGPKGTETGWEV
jgi:hypothetical protein